MSSYRIVTWSLLGAVILLHVVLFLRMRGRLLKGEDVDWTSLNITMPVLFVSFSRPTLLTARLGFGTGIVLVALYAVGVLLVRRIKGREAYLEGLSFGLGESAVLAAACGWGTLVLPAAG